MSIFDKRVSFKPFEYPEVVDFEDAINHSYWLVSEWNFISDIQDFNVRLNDKEKNVIKNALLAISQIEVNVKRFWTYLGERFPKAEFEQVGVTFGECHVEGTEILTPSGWKDFRDIKQGDDVIQYNNGRLEITNVLFKTNRFYSGNIHKLHKKAFEARITPNHKLIYFNRNGELKNKAIKDLGVKNSNNKLPEAGYLTGDINKLSWEERLFIAIQADGNLRMWKDSNENHHIRGKNTDSHTYEISIKKERKKKRLLEILSNLPYVVRTFNDKRDGYLKLEIDVPKSQFNYKNFNWVDLKNKSYLWCRDFIEELSYWDGHRINNKKDCKIKYSNTNKLAADKVQAIGTCAGYKCNLITYKDSRKESYKDTYIVSFIENREKTSFSALKEDILSYTGNVYCVSVNSGAIITRYKDSTFISHNSEVRHAKAYSHLLELLGLNDDFSTLLTNPVIQGRVDYLTKYLRGAADNSNENFTLTLALFSIFIENVSLFSQFVVIKSFNKYKNLLKDVDNVVQATQKEELIHAMLGAYIIKEIQKEFPEWFNEDFYKKLYRACKKAYNAECDIIDWIFENGDLDFITSNTVKEFTKNRFNESMLMVGGEPVFEVDLKELDKLSWFNDEIHAEVNVDFFNKRPVTYSKKMQPINAEDLF